MKREEIIALAQKSGFEPIAHDDWVCFTEEIERLVRSVIAAEREACAKVAEEPSATTYECTVACGGQAQTFTQRFPKDATEIAKAIRARDQE